jgi:hypothetical protein
MRSAFLATALLCAALIAPAAARDLGQWGEEPQAVQDWYRDARLTEAAQKRLHFVGCCKDSDVVHTRFRVDKSTGADHWLYQRLDTGEWEQIPDDIVHWNESSPDNKPTLFALSYDFNGNPAGTLTCFYPPSGGF